MRLLDNDLDKKIDNITVCLTHAEAVELRDTIEDLLRKSEGKQGHIPDYECNKELTICIYDQNNLDDSFHERLKTLILKDL